MYINRVAAHLKNKESGMIVIRCLLVLIAFRGLFYYHVLLNPLILIFFLLSFFTPFLLFYYQLRSAVNVTSVIKICLIIDFFYFALQYNFEVLDIYEQ